MELLRQTGTGPPRFPPHPQRRRQHARGESWRPGEDLNPRPAAEKIASTLRNNHRLPSQACSGRQTAALRRTALRRAAAPLWPCCIVKLSPESGQTQTLPTYSSAAPTGSLRSRNAPVANTTALKPQSSTRSRKPLSQPILSSTLWVQRRLSGRCAAYTAKLPIRGGDPSVGDPGLGNAPCHR